MKPLSMILLAALVLVSSGCASSKTSSASNNANAITAAGLIVPAAIGGKLGTPTNPEISKKELDKASAETK